MNAGRWTRGLGAVCAALALSATAYGATTVQSLGPSALERDSEEATLQFPFGARADSTLEGAAVSLVFAERSGTGKLPQAIEVRVNGALLSRLGPEVLARAREEHVIPVPDDVLRDRNVLSLTLLPDGAGPDCGGVPPGAWRILDAVRVQGDASPAPFPGELSLLPLPFFDKDFDRDPVVAITFATPPDDEALKTAAVLAGWLGIEAGRPVRFSVHVGELPPRHGIVLVDGPESARRLGLPVPEGPELRMQQGREQDGVPSTLLLVAGRDAAEARGAAEQLARARMSHAAWLTGPRARVPLAASPPPLAPRSARRWVRPDERVVLAEVPGLPSLEHRGTAPGALRVDFRISPDVWVWPEEVVPLELGYVVEQPPGEEPPRIDAMFNDAYLGALPFDPGDGDTPRRARLWIRRDHLRGFNTLQLHVRYPDDERACRAGATAPTRVFLTRESALDLGAARHFAELPDLGMFLYDGYPFTEVPDLGDTLAVLADQPGPSELSTFLSVISQFAALTGEPGSRLEITRASRIGDEPNVDKELLVIGVPGEHEFLTTLTPELPMRVTPSGLRPQPPGKEQTVSRWLRAELGSSELERAEAVSARVRTAAAVMQVESPLKSGRSAVVIAATSADALPAMPELLAPARSQTGVADTLVESGGELWMFQLGPRFGRGQLPVTTRARWELSRRPMLLLPLLLCGAALAAVFVRTVVEKKAAQRLGLAARTGREAR